MFFSPNSLEPHLWVACISTNWPPTVHFRRSLAQAECVSTFFPFSLNFFHSFPLSSQAPKLSKGAQTAQVDRPPNWSPNWRASRWPDLRAGPKSGRAALQRQSAGLNLGSHLHLAAQLGRQSRTLPNSPNFNPFLLFSFPLFKRPTFLFLDVAIN